MERIEVVKPASGGTSKPHIKASLQQSATGSSPRASRVRSLSLITHHAAGLLEVDNHILPRSYHCITVCTLHAKGDSPGHSRDCPSSSPLSLEGYKFRLTFYAAIL